MDKKEIKSLRKFQLIFINVFLVSFVILTVIGLMTGTYRLILALIGVLGLVFGLIQKKSPKFGLLPKLDKIREYEKVKLAKDNEKMMTQANPAALGLVLILQAFFNRNFNTSVSADSIPLISVITILVLLIINGLQIYHNNKVDNSTPEELKGFVKNYRWIEIVIGILLAIIIIIAIFAYLFFFES